MQPRESKNVPMSETLADFTERGAFDLSTGDIHVWHTRVGSWRPFLAELAESLDAEERARWQRFVRSADRERFVVCRGLLRHLLARYGVGPAGKVAFEYEPRGKPGLAKSMSQNDLRFNLAHSRDALVFAVARSRRIGVDVELVRNVENADAIARRNFAPEELAVYFGVDAAARMATFFRVWTRKEAFIKATGEGLYRALDSFAVTLDFAAAGFLRIDRSEIDWTCWSLHDLTLEATYPVALATDCAATVVNRWLTPDC